MSACALLVSLRTNAGCSLNSPFFAHSDPAPGLRDAQLVCADFIDCRIDVIRKNQRQNRPQCWQRRCGQSTAVYPFSYTSEIERHRSACRMSSFRFHDVLKSDDESTKAGPDRIGPSESSESTGLHRQFLLFGTERPAHTSIQPPAANMSSPASKPVERRNSPVR